MLAAVVVAAMLPFLASRQFYLSGDTIAQWLPVSRRIGDLLIAGDSHLMDPTMWRGGNFVAEGRFGLWNPLALLLDVAVLQLDDLAVAMLLVVMVHLLLLATGVYLLAREYDAAPWPAAAVGLAAATGGWTIWMDAAWWIPQLASFAFTPFVWVAARRVARGAGGPIWIVIAAALCVTSGNPYSNIVFFVIVVAVAAEFGDRRRLAPLLGLAAALVSIGLLVIFLYVAFRQTSVVGTRESALSNDETWSPGAGDFLTLSSPTSTPFVPNFGRAVLGFPAVYLSWFVLPLAPWLRWRHLVGRRYAGVAIFAGVLFMLSLGPSEFWLFRWPLRLVPYLYLPVLIAFAVLLSHGVATDLVRRRVGVTAGIVAAGGYLAWSDVPEDLRWHFAAVVLVAVATAVTLLVGIRSRIGVGPVMIVATLAVLAFQLQWRPLNESVRHYRMPDSAASYEALFGDRYVGNVVQIGGFDALPGDQRSPESGYRDLAFGSAMSIGGTASVTQYSGIGFVAHDQALCLVFDGSTCADAWDRLWQTVGASGASLADVLRAETIVVQRSLLDTADFPAPTRRWEIAEVTDAAVVWRRTEPLPWPGAGLSDVGGPLAVIEAASTGAHSESLTFERGGEGPVQLTFARLAWPGYTATLDGQPLTIGTGPAGLLTVDIPADADGGEVSVSWKPPYWRTSLAALALSVLVAIAAQVAWVRMRRPD